MGIDLSEPEALILRNVTLGDLVLLEILLLASDDVLHKVWENDHEKILGLTHGEVLYSWQAGLGLGHKQQVGLVLGRGFGCPGGRQHLDLRILPLWDLVCTFH